MTVRELIDRLSELPKDWKVEGVGSGNLYAWEDWNHPEPSAGKRYAHILIDGRPTLHRTRRG